MEPSLGLLEFDSIAVGIEAGDAMAKRAPIDVLHAGTVHPGRYLVLVGGAVADVEEALDAGRSVGGPSLIDSVFLPNVHPGVAAAIAGARQPGEGDALGVIETTTVAAIIDAADAGIKGAAVRIIELRLADGLGGKGYLLFDGDVGDVEAAVEIGTARIVGRPWTARVIARLHREMRGNLEADARFRNRVRHGLDAGAADGSNDAGPGSLPSRRTPSSRPRRTAAQGTPRAPSDEPAESSPTSGEARPARRGPARRTGRRPE